MNKLTEEYCKSVARSCKTTKEFWCNHRSVATKAVRMGWYKSYTWLRRERRPRNSWTYEACLVESSKYRTLRDFRKKSPTAYVKSVRNGWLHHFGLERLQDEKHFWTQDTCRKEARKYRTKGEFRLACPSAYYMALHKGWMPSFTFLGRKKYTRKEKV